MNSDSRLLLVTLLVTLLLAGCEPVWGPPSPKVATVSTLAGSGEAGYAEGSGVEAQFNFPSGLAVDSAGNLYVADAFNHCIRKITPQGVVSTLAGNGSSGYADGPGAQAQFNLPAGVAVDASGNVYVADEGNHCVRKISY